VTAQGDNPEVLPAEALKAEFISRRGYWAPFWDDMLELDPEFFRAYTEFSSVPWRTGTLEPKIRELIYIAIDASATHMYEPGIRQHVRNALRAGATRAEVMEVLELVSVLGIHACTVAAPILMQEWREYDAESRAGEPAGKETGPASTDSTSDEGKSNGSNQR
jgi:alkylhydroperoxidase/carboxymuconolactone decarboxylase family protein YurZ